MFSRHEIEKLREIFQPSPIKQTHPFAVPILTALLGLGAGFILANKQGEEARKNTKMDRRIIAIREVSELVYRKGPMLEETILNAWETADSELTAVNANPAWPCKPEEACSSEQFTENQREAGDLAEKARQVVNEADQLLAEIATEDAVMSSLFKNGGPSRFTVEFPAALKMTLKEKAKLIGEAMSPYKPPPAPALSGRRTTPFHKDKGESGKGQRWPIPPEAMKYFKTLQAQTRDLAIFQLRLSEDAFENRDELIGSQLLLLYNRTKFAIEHLDQ